MVGQAFPIICVESHRNTNGVQEESPQQSTRTTQDEATYKHFPLLPRYGKMH